MSHEFLLNFFRLQLLCQYPVIPPFCCGTRPGECTSVCSGSVLNVPGLCYLPLVDHLVRGQGFIFLFVCVCVCVWILSPLLKFEGEGQRSGIILRSPPAVNVMYTDLSLSFIALCH